MLFVVGDHLAGALTGAVTALAVRGVGAGGTDMVVAMLLGAVVGSAVHLLLALLFSPLLGPFQVMVPGSLIGMYGGMLFAMRDSVHGGSPTLSSAVLVGGLFGAVVTAGVELYDRALRPEGSDR
ncbi:MAG: hypothetical protein HYY35_06675 [Deltaproteobacteria bacterium]|nr:hypothetical protein [Deltaproteobacteria bacterium]